MDTFLSLLAVAVVGVVAVGFFWAVDALIELWTGRNGPGKEGG